MSDAPRWHATVFYRSNAGLIEVQHDFEEIADLHNLIEHGPNFYTIDRIEVRPTQTRVGPMTLEQAAAEARGLIDGR